MYIFIIFILVLFLYYLKCVLKLSIDWQSLYRKGFQKIDNAFGLFCYTGKQGKGKTYSVIRFCVDRKLATDCQIITNVTSFKRFSDTVFITDIKELIDYVLEYCESLPEDKEPNILIFFDEIFTILEKNKSIDKEIRSFISQLRKRRIILLTTAQEWLELNMTFRRYCRFQVDCNMISMPITKSAILINNVYDAEQMKWSSDDNEYIAPIVSTNISKGNLHIINSYDTFETIKVTKK